MTDVSIIPDGYRLKRTGYPVKGESILGRNNEVLMCQGALTHTVCAIVEPVGGKGYEANANLRRRDGESPQDQELTPEG